MLPVGWVSMPRHPITFPSGGPKHRSLTSTERTLKQAQQLISQLFEEMRLGFSNPRYCATPQWKAMFGDKQSMVANLQKLVATLLTLPVEEDMPHGAAAVTLDSLTAAELGEFRAWMETELQKQAAPKD